MFLEGVVADFLFSPPYWVPSMVWRVQGDFWHFLDTAKQVQDLMQRIRLEDRGFVVVDLMGRDLSNNRDSVLEAAIQGRQLRPTPLVF